MEGQSVPDQDSLIGSWEVTVIPSGEDPTSTPYLFTLMADGVVLVSSAPVLTDEQEPGVDVLSVRSLGHGSWRIEGADRVITFVRLLSDSAGVYLGQRLTRVDVEEISSSNEWKGRFFVRAVDSLGNDRGRGRGEMRGVQVPEVDDDPFAGGTIGGVKP